MTKEDETKEEIKRLINELSKAEPHIYLNNASELKRQSRKRFIKDIINTIVKT